MDALTGGQIVLIIFFICWFGGTAIEQYSKAKYGNRSCENKKNEEKEIK
jgi:hypothetical protein